MDSDQLKLDDSVMPLGQIFPGKMNDRLSVSWCWIRYREVKRSIVLADCCSKAAEEQKEWQPIQKMKEAIEPDVIRVCAFAWRPHVNRCHQDVKGFNQDILGPAGILTPAFALGSGRTAKNTTRKQQRKEKEVNVDTGNEHPSSKNRVILAPNGHRAHCCLQIETLPRASHIWRNCNIGCVQQSQCRNVKVSRSANAGINVFAMPRLARESRADRGFKPKTWRHDLLDTELNWAAPQSGHTAADLVYHTATGWTHWDLGAVF